MDENIKEYAELCQVALHRERLLKTKESLFKLERAMAHLTFDYEVGTFVHMRDEYIDLKNKKCTVNGEKLNKITLKMQPLIKKLQMMRDNPKVVKYLELEKEYEVLLDILGDYAQSINIDFREAISDYQVPGIYVFQGYFNNDKTLIQTKNIIRQDSKVLYTRPTNNTIIFPIADMTSKRDLRHFYNKISFKYLEAMTYDYSFSLDNKKLGKVRYNR